MQGRDREKPHRLCGQILHIHTACSVPLKEKDIPLWIIQHISKTVAKQTETTKDRLLSEEAETWRFHLQAERGW